MDIKVETAAKRLRAAAESGVTCEPIRTLIGVTDLETAYAIQEVNLSLIHI